MRIVTLLTCMSMLLPGVGQAAWDYPSSPRGDHVDHYHGAAVADPYRWLEELDSAETKAWVQQQNALTESVVAGFSERARVKARLTELWNFPRQGLPFKEANWYFYTKNDGLQNQSPLYVTDGLHGQERLLIDPNILSDDGTVALAMTAPSPGGKWLGYGLARAGSDWCELRLRDVATGRDAEDVVRWAKFTGLSWTDDAAGFFYARYPAPAEGDSKVFSKLENRQICYHRVGSPQSEDRVVFAAPENPDWFFDGEVSSDGRWLVVSISPPGQNGNGISVINLGDPQQPRFDGAAQTVVATFDQAYTYLGNVGTVFYFLTDAGAPRGRIVTMDLATSAPRPVTVIAESADTIESARISAGRLVLTYLHDVVSRVAVFTLEGRPAGEIALPGLGAVSGLSGKFKDPELFVGYSSFLTPGTVLRHDLSAGKTEVHHVTKVAFDADRYETRQVFYPSKDGTKIPMFLVHKKGLVLDGSAPTWLYGYGGFNIVLKPQFAVPPLVWIEQGGVYAVANLRGGGEYGEAWHLAGTKERKQNVFDDYIAAADWLVAQRYTTHPRIVLDGRSNGGLLLGAVLNQRPDLAGAAVPAVGVMDMLRYHRFTVGAAWASDFGNSDTREGFAYLRAYSPLHTVRVGAKYPAILITTGDHDDRVFPAHSYKYTAALQAAADRTSGPVLIQVQSNAGHGGSSGTSSVSKTIDDWAARMGFGAHYTGWGSQ